MKKIIVLLLAAMLLLSLCACGEEIPEGHSDTQVTGAPKPNTATEETPEITENSDTEVTEPSESEEVTEPSETTPVDTDKLELAKSCVGKDVSELYKLIGEPESSDYAPSCLVDGEDGMLYYDGFVVYTTRENGVENVYYVE